MELIANIPHHMKCHRTLRTVEVYKGIEMGALHNFALGGGYSVELLEGSEGQCQQEGTGFIVEELHDPGEEKDK